MPRLPTSTAVRPVFATFCALLEAPQDASSEEEDTCESASCSEEEDTCVSASRRYQGIDMVFDSMNSSPTSTPWT